MQVPIKIIPLKHDTKYIKFINVQDAEFRKFYTFILMTVILRHLLGQQHSR